MPTAADNETAPLLADEHHTAGSDHGSVGTISATDFADGDPENPLEWAPSFKWFIVFLLAMSAFTVYVLRTAETFVAKAFQRNMQIV